MYNVTFSSDTELRCFHRSERKELKGSLNLDLDSLQVTNDDSSKKPDSPRTLMIKANLEKVSISQ